MKGREPWLGLTTIAGLALMLVAEGLADAVGLVVAAIPVIYAAVAVRQARAHR